MLEGLLGFLMFFTAVFLILLILVQRGRGGGLAGVFGSSGGQSAFGAKAGDLFTRITIGVVAFWIVLCVVTIRILGVQEGLLGEMGNSASGETTHQEAPASPSDSGGSGQPVLPEAPSPAPDSGSSSGG